MRPVGSEPGTTPSTNGFSISTSLFRKDRWRVRNAVFQGKQLSDATLTRAAHGLAAHVLTGELRMLRLSRISGWLNLVVGAGFAGLGIVVLVTDRGASGLVLGVLGLIGSVIFMFVGAVFAFENPKQIRRNAARALELNKES